MKFSNLAALLTDSSLRRAYLCNICIVAAFIFVAFLVGNPSFVYNYKQRLSSLGMTVVPLPPKISSRGIAVAPLPPVQKTKINFCKAQQKPPGSEKLPKGIIRETSDLEMCTSQDLPNFLLKKHLPKHSMAQSKKESQSLLAMAVGIKQKKDVNKIVQKFLSRNFTVMLFHYDGIVDKWRDFQWCDRVLHVAAVNQTKWWFAKRFLHPDIIADHDYIFLWDEDLGVEHFDPGRYISIIRREGLDISQPALDPAKSEVHHQITARVWKADVHRRTYKPKDNGGCYLNSTAPPCTGWVEMMAPVFSRTSWRCVWYMIQNDLIHAWGLDIKLGYCVKGDRTQNIGVVDSEYVIHKGIPTLGGSDNDKKNSDATRGSSSLSTTMGHGNEKRYAVRRRSYAELMLFEKRWKKAAEEDKCWHDPYPEPVNMSTM